MDTFTQRAIAAALTTTSHPPTISQSTGLAYSVQPRQRIRESLRPQPAMRAAPSEPISSWQPRSDVREIPSRPAPAPQGLNDSRPLQMPSRRPPEPPASRSLPASPLTNSGDIALALLRQQLDRLSNRVEASRQPTDSKAVPTNTTLPVQSSAAKVVLKEARQEAGPSNGEGVLLRKVLEVETSVAHHINQHVLERAKAMRAADQARESVDDCEYKISEIGALFDSRVAGMKERLDSRLSTLATLRKDTLSQLRTRIGSELRSLISEYGFEEIDDGATTIEQKVASQQKTACVAKRSVLSAVARQREAANDLLALLGQFSAHSDAQMAALQADLGSQMERLQEQLQGAHYVAHKSEASSISEGRENFLSTVDFVRKALSALRLERHEFETKFIDRIAHITVEGKGPPQGATAEARGRLRYSETSGMDDGDVAVRGSLAKRLYR